MSGTTDDDDRSVEPMGLAPEPGALPLAPLERDRGLGLSFAVDGDRVVAAFTPGFAHRGAPGFLHGGFAAMALDETLAAVGWLLDGAHVVTATLHLRYRRPVPLSAGPLRIEAWRVGRGSPRRWRVEGRLCLADGTVAVEAQGIFVAAPESMRMAT